MHVQCLIGTFTHYGVVRRCFSSYLKIHGIIRCWLNRLCCHFNESVGLLCPCYIVFFCIIVYLQEDFIIYWWLINFSPLITKTLLLKNVKSCVYVIISLLLWLFHVTMSPVHVTYNLYAVIQKLMTLWHIFLFLNVLIWNDMINKWTDQLNSLVWLTFNMISRQMSMLHTKNHYKDLTITKRVTEIIFLHEPDQIMLTVVCQVNEYQILVKFLVRTNFLKMCYVTQLPHNLPLHNTSTVQRGVHIVKWWENTYISYFNDYFMENNDLK